MNDPRPIAPAVAVARALRISGGQYVLGTGDYRPRVVNGQAIDTPWTTRERDGMIGSDCAGFVCWCLRLPRHRPGINAGNPSGIETYDVADDLNSGSFLGDAFGAQDLFAVVSDAPQVGDVLAYPTIRLHGLTFVGHTAIVVGVSRVTASGDYHELDIAQCKGPDGRAPGVVYTDGSVFAHHNDQWPKPEHRAWLLRVVP